MTVSVNGTVLWVDPEVAVTVMVVVLADVPVVVGVFCALELFWIVLPHPMLAISRRARTAKSGFTAWHGCPLPSLERPTVRSPDNESRLSASASAQSHNVCGKVAVTVQGNKPVCAVVEIDTVIGTVLLPVSVTEFGEVAQFAPAGAPLHAIVTVPLKPVD